MSSVFEGKARGGPLDGKYLCRSTPWYYVRENDHTELSKIGNGQVAHIEEFDVHRYVWKRWVDEEGTIFGVWDYEGKKKWPC